jgi:ketosteroid isomerase-like protein
VTHDIPAAAHDPGAGGNQSDVTTDRASAFADALQRFEQDHDLDAFVAVFAEEAELLRPEQRSGERGTDGARSFWQAYLDQFGEIRSNFHRVVEAGNLAQLEWTSSGTLGSGREVTYEGVSLLEFDDDRRVRRFATYYDTAALSSRIG